MKKCSRHSCDNDSLREDSFYGTRFGEYALIALAILVNSFLIGFGLSVSPRSLRGMDRDRRTDIVRTVLDSLRIGRTLPDIRHLCPDPDMPDTQEKQTEEYRQYNQ